MFAYTIDSESNPLVLMGGTKGNHILEKMVCGKDGIDNDWTENDVIDPVAISSEHWAAIKNRSTNIDLQRDFTNDCIKKFEIYLVDKHRGGVNNCPTDSQSPHITLDLIHPLLKDSPSGIYIYSYNSFLQSRFSL